MSIRILTTWLFAGFLAAVACAQEAKPDTPPAAKVTYDDHVKPIFREHCLSCHNQEQKKGGLALDNYAATMAGGAVAIALVRRPRRC